MYNLNINSYMKIILIRINKISANFIHIANQIINDDKF